MFFPTDLIYVDYYETADQLKENMCLRRQRSKSSISLAMLFGFFFEVVKIFH